MSWLTLSSCQNSVLSYPSMLCLHTSCWMSLLQFPKRVSALNKYSLANRGRTICADRSFREMADLLVSSL